MWWGLTVHKCGICVYLGKLGSIVNMQKCDIMLFYNLYTPNYIFSTCQHLHLLYESCFVAISTYWVCLEINIYFWQDLDEHCFVSFISFSEQKIWLPAWVPWHCDALPQRFCETQPWQQQSPLPSPPLLHLSYPPLLLRWLQLSKNQHLHSKHRLLLMASSRRSS